MELDYLAYKFMTLLYRLYDVVLPDEQIGEKIIQTAGFVE